MATRGPTTQPAAPLCDYCNQKPKFSNHQYCSKTCASQAATLCNQCHKKPKFQNFEYCGKACAAVAKPAVRKPAAAPAQVQPAVAATPKAPKAKSAHPQKAAATAQPAFDPIQLAKLVAQQLPQVQALIASANAAPAVPAAPITQPVPAAPASQVVPVVAKSKNPFLNLINNIQQPASANGTSAALLNALPAAQSLHISTQPPADSTECLIPDCDQPVHVDAKGLRTSDYCSMRHREEAVATGLASPCIMCLTLPQSELDYFCGRACRDESMNKFE